MKVHRCFDSHVHWLAVGFPYIDLSSVKNLKDISYEKSDFVEDWLWGFGLKTNKELSLNDLDSVLKERPLCFSRQDGHAIWLNSQACERLGVVPQSFWQENEAAQMREKISKLSKISDKSALLRASQKLNAKGVTHIRDLGMGACQWDQAVQLHKEGRLTLAVEGFFVVDSISCYKTVIQQALKAQNSSTKLLRCQGIKVFYDGTLWGKTAYLSENYLNDTTCGSALISIKKLREILSQAWQSGLEVAVHTIGNQAVKDVLQEAHSLWQQGLKGHLHLEHVQVMDLSCLEKMHPKFVTCHLQPCHWLSDRKFLESSLPKSLMEGLFRWDWLEQKGVPFYFGTDAPVEQGGLEVNYQVISELPSLAQDFTFYHTHPDPNFAKGSYSQWSETDELHLKLEKVVFCGLEVEIFQKT